VKKDNSSIFGTAVGTSLWALFYAFLVLKLCGVVAWPWMWVCAPLLALCGFVVLCTGVGLALLAYASLRATFRGRR
jgi:hypothetical protein